MNIKSVVRVMNFHALLRVDSSRRKAEKYLMMEQEITRMIRLMMNNRNFLLDKKISKADASAPILNIYIGSDFGFCGSINSSINSKLKETGNIYKIIVGKKLAKNNAVQSLTREQFDEYFPKIYQELELAIRQLKYSQINLIYNHYHNMSSIETVKKCIYPLDVQITQDNVDEASAYKEDFSIEGDARRILEDLILAYLEFEVKIAFINSSASENIMRQNATSDSLKKIDEMEEEEVRIARKMKNQKAFQKVIDSYTKQKGIEK